MRTISLSLIFLAGCQSFKFDNTYQTKPYTTTHSYIQQTQYIPGKGYECVTDDQCGNNGLICYKNNIDNSIGVCAQVQ